MYELDIEDSNGGKDLSRFCLNEDFDEGDGLFVWDVEVMFLHEEIAA